MTHEVKATIQQCASKRKLTVTGFLIRAGFGRATRLRAEVDAINLLSACAYELTHMHALLRALEACHCQVIDAEIINDQMRKITAKIQRVCQSSSNCSE